MKIRTADYIADFLANNGITEVFSVVGGGAMHLNNALGVNKRLHCTYNHHEQASAMAAESYAKVTNKPAVVCVTSGPGGTNALTGVLSAWLDNQPMIVISGQVRYNITVESTGLNLRQFGEQEYEIIKSVKAMTKYAVMVDRAEDIEYHLAKALHLATSGRKGPCWIDVPMDIQGCMIDTDHLTRYFPEQAASDVSSDVATILRELARSHCPIIIAGSGVRSSGCLDDFKKLIHRMKIPVICPTSIVDLFQNDDPLYFGMFGVFGGRTGNFIIQNADLLISFGCRMSFKQIGFNYEDFAPNAKKIVIDVDKEELKKKTIQIDFPINADLANIVKGLGEYSGEFANNTNQKWLEYCSFLKGKFSPVTDEQRRSVSISAYRFADEWNSLISEGSITVVGNNCAAVSFLQVGTTKRGQRLFGNVNCGSMGYDIPAAIGAAIASGGPVFCITGEGSSQMNIQELQTIVHNHLPVKIVIFNNNSYQAVVQSQGRFFDGVLAGCDNDSGISFPSFEKLSLAYGFPYRSISRSEEIAMAIKWLEEVQTYAILEVFQVEPDPIIPKLSSKKLDNGQLISPPIDDLFPFLGREEYSSCLFSNYAQERA
ncbi:thiamine pyrophosphate-binding protein [Synergistaceae bacterium OttesenSCG-928-I11]|nr:thiamine pyrophosphate-binding protein [Synergistaceae bacterium OttesenSCG-928-I11]